MTSESFAAPPAACTVLTDPAGDATLSGLPTGDGHVDVESVAVRLDGRLLHLRIANADMVEERRGAWHVTFVSRGRSVQVTAANGTWVNVGRTDGTSGFYAGRAGQARKEVSGSFDYAADVIEVRVPLTALGDAAPRRGDVLSGFRVDAKEQVLNGANVTEVAYEDSAEATTRYVAGRRC